MRLRERKTTTIKAQNGTHTSWLSHRMALRNDHPTIKNKKAFFEYEILDRFVAGISLQGTEVKSIRLGKVKLGEAFCLVNSNMEMEIQQMEISQYAFGNVHNHDATRNRKLLLHKKEIKKIHQKAKEGGLTIVPLKMFFMKGKIKIEIALAKGKKLHDKRQDMKAKDAKRDMDRAMKGD